MHLLINESLRHWLDWHASIQMHNLSLQILVLHLEQLYFPFEIENYLFFGIYLDDGFVLNIHRSSRKIKCRYRLIPITLRRTNASNKQCS